MIITELTDRFDVEIEPNDVILNTYDSESGRNIDFALRPGEARQLAGLLIESAHEADAL